MSWHAYGRCGGTIAVLRANPVVEPACLLRLRVNDCSAAGQPGDRADRLLRVYGDNDISAASQPVVEPACLRRMRGNDNSDAGQPDG